MILLGDPTVVLGDPTVVLGDGDPMILLEDPTIVLGDPTVVLGDPMVVLGDPTVVLLVHRKTQTARADMIDVFIADPARPCRLFNTARFGARLLCLTRGPAITV